MLTDSNSASFSIQPDSQGSSENKLSLPVCQYWWTGRLSYEEARQLQESLAIQIAAGKIPPTLLLLEHPHTYTLGRRGEEKNLLWDTETLQERGVSVHWIDRGGDITYHGPGQLVGYPLIALGRPTVQSGASRLPQADYLGYLRALEEMLILALARLGVEGLQVKGKTGIWVRKDDRVDKLASIGVKVDAQGISRHGFALNVDPDMSYWQGIIACGLPDDQMTSLAMLLTSPPPMQQVCQAVISAFSKQFHFRMVKYP
jgi:lipoate-protein ligase B